MVSIPATSLYGLGRQQPFQDLSKSLLTHLNLFTPQEAQSQAVPGTRTETEPTGSSPSDLQEQRKLADDKVRAQSCPVVAFWTSNELLALDYLGSS